MLTIQLKRRQFLLTAASLGATTVWANADPQVLRIVSPYPAGGSVDFWVRALKQELESGHGFNVQPVNQPGASGIIAANQILNAPPIGPSTLLLAGTALFSLIPLLPDANNLKFNLNEVFTPLAILWEEPFFVTVRSDSGFQSFEDLVAQARYRTTPLSFGSTGTQSTGGVFFEHFAKTQGLVMTHVPFKGMTEMVTSLLGKHIDVGVLSYQQAKAHVEANNFRLLASTGNTRSALAPRVPTLKELKKIDIDGTVWFGLFIKKATDAETLKRLQSAFRRVLDSSSLRNIMAANGYSVLALMGQEAVNYVRQSNADWEKMLPR